MITRSMRVQDVHRNWFVVDARDLILGRLASLIALKLRGKDKPQFTPHVNMGDGVIVVNAEHVHLTGQKLKQKKFYWHTGYPGGIKERTMGETLSGKHPERAVIKAVERMLPRGPLGRDMMRNLKVYAGEQHPHEGQNPQKWDVGSLNAKNNKRV